MNAIKAIFIKQLNDVFKNPTVTMMFVMFPVMAFAFVSFMDAEDPFVVVSGLAISSMMMMPIVAISLNIAEDVEYRSLRFLVMAGVKPTQYLIGLASFVMVLSFAAMVSFGIIGELSGSDFVIFLAVSFLGCLVALLIGAVIGLFSKNIQQANLFASCIGMILGFLPIFSMFSPDIVQATYFLFPQQISIILNYIALGGGDVAMEFFNHIGIYDINLLRSGLIIFANAVVFIGLFVFIYKKKGLSGE